MNWDYNKNKKKGGNVMNKAKVLIVYILAVAMLFATAACNTSKDDQSKEGEQTQQETSAQKTETEKEKEPVTINFAMIAFANEIPGWTEMVGAANELLAPQKISIEIKKIPAKGWSEYYQKVVTQMAAGKGPDIGRIAESQMPHLIANEHVVELTEYLESLDMSLYFDATFRNSGFSDGKYFGVPSGIYYMLMYYNKDMFDTAGLPYPSSDWSNPISFEQVREYAQKFTSGEGANKKFGFSAGPYMAFMGMYSMSNGGKNVFNEDGTCALGSTETRGVYKWFDSMLKTDYSMPRPTDTKIMGAMDMFKAGRIAMIVDGTWWHSSIKNDIKDFKVGIAAVPAGKGRAYSSMFVDNFIVFTGTKHEKEAWEAVKAIISKGGFDALAATGVGGTPVVRSTLKELQDTMIGDVFSEDDKQAFMNGLDYTLSVPYNNKYDAVDQLINAVMDEWLLDIIPVDEFVDKIVKMVDEEMSKE